MNLISKAEACAVLGVSVSTLGRLVLDGSIAKYKVRGSCRFDKDELEKYLASCRVKYLPPVRVDRKLSASSRKCEYVPGMKVV